MGEGGVTSNLIDIMTFISNSPKAKIYDFLFFNITGKMGTKKDLLVLMVRFAGDDGHIFSAKLRFFSGIKY